MFLNKDITVHFGLEIAVLTFLNLKNDEKKAVDLLLN